MSISAYIKEIGRGTKGARSLSRAQAQELMGLLLDNRVSDLELGAFCIAMRFKGESAEELAGFLDAVAARQAPWPRQATAAVVLPSYNGARKLPNLTPLLAALLAREGLPVLVHGCDTEDKRIGTEAVWHALQWPALSTPAVLQPGQAAWIRTRHLLPALEKLLQLRRRIGLRNPAHSIVKLLDPLERPQPGSAAIPSLVVGSYTHPDYARPMAETLALRQASGLLLRGTEGESVAAPNREPASQGVLAGQTCFARSAVHSSQYAADAAAATELPPGLDAQQTAELIRDMLDGRQPVPAPITQQVQQIKTLHAAMCAPNTHNLDQLQSLNRC
jgi:anthranilate phosphoribosyltransferase